VPLALNQHHCFQPLITKPWSTPSQCQLKF
jgi:hypothetical protein